MSSTFFSNYIFFSRVFPYLEFNVFKVVCCRFSVCGKGYIFVLFPTYNKSELDVFDTGQIKVWQISPNESIIMYNPFSHTTILKQIALNIICQKIENLYNWMDNKLWLKVENIFSKGEIARYEQFLLLSLCFQKAVCCRGVRKRPYKGKG